MMGELQPWEKGLAPSSLASWGTCTPWVTGQPGLAPVSQSSVLPGGGGESGREVLPWLTVLTPWMPVFDCPLGTGPGRRASRSACLRQLLPGLCPPGSGLRPLSPCSQQRRPRLVSSPGHRGAGKQPRGASPAPQAQERVEPRQGPRGSGGPTPAQSAGGTASASLSGFQVCVFALPRGLGSSWTFCPLPPHLTHPTPALSLPGLCLIFTVPGMHEPLQ